jgi:hypothetical protein
MALVSKSISSTICRQYMQFTFFQVVMRFWKSNKIHVLYIFLEVITTVTFTDSVTAMFRSRYYKKPLIPMLLWLAYNNVCPHLKVWHEACALRMMSLAIFSLFAAFVNYPILTIVLPLHITIYYVTNAAPSLNRTFVFT